MAVRKKKSKYQDQLWQSIFDDLKQKLGKTPTLTEVQAEYNRRYGGGRNGSSKTVEYD